MKSNKIKFLFSLLVLVACKKEEVSPPLVECVQCTIYEYQQEFDDTIVSIFLDPDTYCLGDSILSYSNNNGIQFLEILDQNLLEFLNQNGYCAYLSDSIDI